jgi:hypothetical protein
MISLRKHKPTEYSRTVNWLLDPLIKSSFGLKREINVYKHVHFIKKNPNVIIWGIYYNGLHVGNITTINRTKCLHEVQIFLGKRSLWGKRLASKAILLLLTITSKNSRLYVRCDASKINFYKRLGFKFSEQLLGAHSHDSSNVIILQAWGRRNG